MKKLISSLVTLSVLMPATALALPGTGPRATITGDIESVLITPEQRFDDEGGEVTIKAENGQIVKAIIQDSTNIISEGRLSRKKVRPRDLTAGMRIRVTGWRVDSAAITASLIVITNVEANPVLSGNAIVASFDGSSITLTNSDGSTSTYAVTNDTEVQLSYKLNGPDALKLVGKQAVFSLSPTDPTRLKVLRITGLPEGKVDRPSTRELRTVRYRRGQ